MALSFFWLDSEVIMPLYDISLPKACGRPQRYSDPINITILMIKRIFQITLRPHRKLLIPWAEVFGEGVWKVKIRQIATSILAETVSSRRYEDTWNYLRTTSLAQRRSQVLSARPTEKSGQSQRTVLMTPGYATITCVVKNKRSQLPLKRSVLMHSGYAVRDRAVVSQRLSESSAR